MQKHFNYHDGSIVNLMSSIAAHFGTQNQYRQLAHLKKTRFKKNILLIVLDGIGYNYLMQMLQGTLFEKRKINKITSVFPSTTAAAITTYLTGAAPQQHAATGWFMHLREIGAVCMPLRFMPRFGGAGLEEDGYIVSDFLQAEPFTQGMDSKNFAIIPRNISGSQYSEFFFGNSQTSGYRTMTGFTRQVKKALKTKKRKKKFIYAYVPFFDTVSHELGNGSIEAYLQFREIEAAIRPIIRSAKDTTILITSDHGMIDADEKHTIFLSDHPRFRECLTQPLCGEPRCAFCYVHRAKTSQFISYYKKHFKKKADLISSEKLISENYFGLFNPHKELIHRIGDFALIAKKNYCFSDSLLGEEPRMLIGNHGGISEDEIFVPLVVI